MSDLSCTAWQTISRTFIVILSQGSEPGRRATTATWNGSFLAGRLHCLDVIGDFMRFQP